MYPILLPITTYLNPFEQKGGNSQHNQGHSAPTVGCISIVDFVKLISKIQLLITNECIETEYRQSQKYLHLSMTQNKALWWTNRKWKRFYASVFIWIIAEDSHIRYPLCIKEDAATWVLKNINVPPHHYTPPWQCFFSPSGVPTWLR